VVIHDDVKCFVLAKSGSFTIRNVYALQQSDRRPILNCVFCIATDLRKCAQNESAIYDLSIPNGEN